MPIKFKPSQTTRRRGESHSTTTHYWIKGTPKEELFKYINEGPKPKVKQKCLNELARRGIAITWKDIEQGL
jgi:hypothetical protein